MTQRSKKSDVDIDVFKGNLKVVVEILEAGGEDRDIGID